MSHRYHASFGKGNSMRKTKRFETTYNNANQNLQFCIDQIEDSHSQRIVQCQSSHFSNCQAYESSQSLQQSALNNFALTSANKDYFFAIERSLLLQNQNLMNHNRYLLDQVKRLFRREKAMKKMLFEHQNTIKMLHRIILDSQINLRRLFEDMVVLIDELQMINSTSEDRIEREELKERQKASILYDKETPETNSLSILNSLQNIKNIFSQSQIMDEKCLRLCTKSTLEHENPEYGQQVHHMTENQSEKSFQGWQSHSNEPDMPILCSFKNKIIDLCTKIQSSQYKTKQSASLHKTQ